MSRKRTTKDGDASENGLTDLPPLPPGWLWAKVDEVGEVKLGRQRSPEHHHGPHMRPYLRVANVYEDRIDLSDVLEMNFTPQEYETYHLRHGDILLNEGQSLEWVGRPAMYRDDLPGACFQNTLVRFRPGPNLLPSFALLVFRYYLHSQRFQKIAKWTVNIAHLGASRFAELEFPLPPKSEQARIVEKFDDLFTKLDAGIVSLKRAKSTLKRYRATVLKAAVEGRLTEEWREKHPDVETGSTLLDRILTERRRRWEERQLAKFADAGKRPPQAWRLKYEPPRPPTPASMPLLPCGWTLGSVDQIAEVGTGTTPSRSNPAFYSGMGIPWITSSAVNSPFVHEATEFVTDKAIDGTTLRLYPPGTLIVALYGEGKTRGKVSELMLESTINQALAALVMDGTLSVCRPYLKWFLAANYENLRRQAVGGMQPNLNLGLIRAITVALPPREEQEAICTEIEQQTSILNEIEAQVETNFKRALRLRRSILKRAFEGRLAPQDPDDEPADRLLERTRTERVDSGMSISGTSRPVRDDARGRDGDLPLFDRQGGANER